MSPGGIAVDGRDLHRELLRHPGRTAIDQIDSELVPWRPQQGTDHEGVRTLAKKMGSGDMPNLVTMAGSSTSTTERPMTSNPAEAMRSGKSAP